MSRRYRTILLAVSILLLLVPAIVAVPGNINQIFHVDLTVAERAALLIGALLVIGSFLLYLAWHAEDGLGATLQGTALWLPWMAALASSALYLASASGPKPTEDVNVWAAMARDRASQSLLVGGGLAGALWLLHAIVDHGYPTARRQSPGWYGLLKSSIAGQRLRAEEISAVCADPNATTIRRQVSGRLEDLEAYLDKPGLNWVTRAGYNVAWSEYHADEEALIGVVSKASLIDIAMSDLLRLDGSEMHGHATLQRGLQAALVELDAKIEPYSRPLVPKDPNEAPVTVVEPAAAPSAAIRARASAKRLGSALSQRARIGSKSKPSTDEGAKPTDADCDAERRSRTVIQTIHSSLNTYRGARWAELGRARWQLMLTTTVAGIVAFLVLALALIRGVHPDQLMAGWAYFLVGAAAGLFLRLRLASEESQVTDDYGLEAARVFQTPLLSGMAAIIGVVLLASLAGSSLGDILTPQSEPAAAAVEASAGPETTGATESVSPSVTEAASTEATESANPSAAAAAVQSTTSTLSNAFSLATYPLGLVIALAFGLTPNLVLQRLGVSARKAKEELVATRPS